MWVLIRAILGAAASSLRSRRELALENLALRQQMGVLRRTLGDGRVRTTRWDRAFWVVLADHWRQWRFALDIVQPATVIRWHREGVRVVLAPEESFPTTRTLSAGPRDH